MPKKMIHYKQWTIPIVYQDKDLIICDKPAQLLTVPIPKSKSDNLQEALQNVFVHQTGFLKAAHRIDRYTTGVVVFAKTKRSHQNLVKQFRSHTPKRVYMALVNGIVEKDGDTLVHYLKRIDESFKNIVTDSNDSEGTRAELSYRVVERLQKHTVIEIELNTGLKNQIRVQFAAIGHPIYGEQQYAENHSDLLDRQALHAWKLTIESPTTGKPIAVNTSVPKDIAYVLKMMRKDDSNVKEI